MAQPATADAGIVAVYPSRVYEPQHEQVVHAELAKQLADLLGYTFGDVRDVAASDTGQVYLLPTGTLIGVDHAQSLGLKDERNLFGGVVPYPFVATKAITHALVQPDAYAPEGWSVDFTRRVQRSVLAGFSAFTLSDARDAGIRLLADGPLRLKPVRATAGRGQLLVRSASELDAALDAMDTSELATWGLTLEEHLEEVTTFSVGQVRVAGLVASYYGTQRLTPDNNGEMVYGGSQLIVVRGDYDSLFRLELSEPQRVAIAQAQLYDDAASTCFHGFFASRRNYDIALGLDGHGRPRSGVLEQSWRVGGASSAEIFALRAFQANPALNKVRATSLEFFGTAEQPPANATVLFRDQDPDVGFISKCVMVEPYGNT
jgi:hypothetical protein